MADRIDLVILDRDGVLVDRERIAVRVDVAVGVEDHDLDRAAARRLGHRDAPPPCWPGNGSTWRGFDKSAVPPLFALGLADLIAAWLDGLGCTAPVTYVGASLGGLGSRQARARQGRSRCWP